MNPVFSGIFRERNEIYTENLAKGTKVYGEKIVKLGSQEFRHWDPTRSKLAASIMNGLTHSPAREGHQILYLGASTGTTVSHLSDILGDSGIVYAVEFAERVFRSLMDLSKKRKNIMPLLADARKPEQYKWIEQVDAVFIDVAQPDETEIAIRNAKIFLKKDGLVFLSVKSQSIDVTKKPEEVYAMERAKLQHDFTILQTINLEPFEDKHAMIVAKL